MVSYSQYNQDRAVDFALNGKINGVFLDIGAHDGFSLSNTLFFERHRGWSGLCVEPIPEVFTRLKENRKCYLENCCILNEERSITFRSVMPPLDMLSGVLEFFDQEHISRIDDAVLKHFGREEAGYQDIIIPGYDLNQLLERYKLYHIDYCSIDTEGAEVAIVKSIDFNRFDIRAFTIENNDKAGELRPYLESFGYVCFSMGLDDLFIKGSYNRLVSVYTRFIRLRLSLPGLLGRLFCKYILRGGG